MMARAGPFGAGNPEPVLALPAHTLAYADQVGENHIRARFKSGDGNMVNAIAFRAAGTPLGQALLDNRGRAMHAAGTSRHRPLAGRGARADAADRRGGQLARRAAPASAATASGSRCRRRGPSCRQANSAWFGPTIWMPMGRPCAPKPAGAASAGQPAMVIGQHAFIHS